MSRIHLLLVVIVLCVSGACGSSDADPAADNEPSKAEAATPSAEFELADWTQATSSVKQAYLGTLQAFNNQLEMLNQGAATDQQFALVVTTNAKRIADAAAAYARALEEAPAIPAERSDVQESVDNLRTALLNGEQAYRVAAGCKRDLGCIEAARAGVVAADEQTGKALTAMPAE